MMLFRRITAVLLGGILQVSLLGVGATPAVGAETGCNKAHSCCQGLSVCPCVKSEENNKPVAPAIPSTQERQYPVIASTDTQIPLMEAASRSLSAPLAIPAGEAFSGYCGVSLRVSFCRYTI